MKKRADREPLKELGMTVFEDPIADEMLEEMRKKLAESFGVTVMGPQVTLRWGRSLKQVSMIVISVTDDACREDPPEDK